MPLAAWKKLVGTLLLLVQFQALALASTFSVAPILIDMPAPGRIATYTVSNQGSKPLQVQIEGRIWTQKDGNDVERPADGLTISPPMAVIPAGGSQIVRVARPAAGSASEQAFRIRFDEVPSGSPANGIFLQTLLRVDVPLFFTAGGKSRPATRWAVGAGRTPGELAIGAINDGERFDRYSTISLYDARGALLLRMKQPLYILARSNRIWVKQAARPIHRGEPVLLVVEQNGSAREHRITVD